LRSGNFIVLNLSYRKYSFFFQGLFLWRNAILYRAWW
jgi:hypothetical protein